MRRWNCRTRQSTPTCFHHEPAARERSLNDTDEMIWVGGVEEWRIKLSQRQLVEAELGNITLNDLTCQGLGKQTAAPWYSKETLETFGFSLQLPICLIKLNILNY